MDTLGPPFTSTLMEYLSGRPIDRSLWQKLDDSTRIRLSDAIVAVKLKDRIGGANLQLQYPMALPVFVYRAWAARATWRVSARY